MAIKARNAVGALLFLGLAALFLWGVLISKPAEDIGFKNEDPSYLFGCYKYGKSQIALEPGFAVFDGEKITISYGKRKELREVFYPQTYPWFDPSKDSFVFKNDRFDLVDLIQDDDGTWTIQIWNTDYLSSKDPTDLDTVYFKKETCVVS